MRLLLVVLVASFLPFSVFGQTYTISTLAGGALPINIRGTDASVGNLSSFAADGAGNIFFAPANYSLVLRLDAQTSLLTLVAGNGTSGFSGDGGPATAAQLGNFLSVALDPAGNLYIADSLNDRIRKVSNGVITTVAGGGFQGLMDKVPATSVILSFPRAVAADAQGNFYIAAFNRFLKVSDGVITTIAGNGTPGFGGDNGPATDAQVNQPPVQGIAVDPAGNLYIVDGTNRIRKVSSGVITTVAGNGTQGFSGDSGPATSAQLFEPVGIAVDSAGSLYIEDKNNYRIRKVSNGVITTVAGNGFSDLSGVNRPVAGASLGDLAGGIAVDSSGGIYIGDSFRIRKIANSFISTIAGNGADGVTGDGGPAIRAELNASSVAVDSAGNVYEVDPQNHCVRKISNGVITTAAGTCGGEAIGHQLVTPTGVAVDSAGAFYVADSYYGTIRRFSNGVVTSVVAEGALNYPAGVAVDSVGNIYVAEQKNNRIRKVSNGVTSTVAGTGVAGFLGDNGAATSAQLSYPTGVAVDSAGNLYIADSNNQRIREVSNGVITTVAGTGIGGFLGDNGPATSAQLLDLGAISVDSAGNLYLTDGEISRVRKVANGIITSIAGNATDGFSGDHGPAHGAQLNGPQGIAVDSTGNVYIADSGNRRVRLLTPDPSPCSYAITPQSLLVPGAGGNFTLTIQTGNSCEWSISGLPYWMLSTASIGMGSANIAVTVEVNHGAIRQANFAVAGFSYSVSQLSVVSVRAVQNAASYAAGSVAPGEIVVLSGSNLGPAQLTQFQIDSRGYVPLELAGTQVSINGFAAPILYTRSDVVAVIVPYEVTGNTAIIVVQYQGDSSTSLYVPLVATVTGVFTFAATGSGQAASLNEDGSLNSATAPAKPGSVITLYATGEGQTSPSGVDGKPANAPFPQPLQSVSVAVGGVSAEVAYAGGAPTEVAGVMQINVRIPDSVQPGQAVPIVVSIANSSSQSNVTIAVAGN